MPLNLTLRATAVLLLLATAIQYFAFEQLPVKTIVVAHIIFALSLFSNKYAQRISIASIGLAVVVPIGAWLDYYSGELTPGFFVFNLVIFIYVAYVAYQSVKDKPR